MSECGRDKDMMCALVFGQGANVPSVSGMLASGVGMTGFYLELNHTSKWCHWHSVIVKWAMVVCISGDLGCNIRILEKVQSADCLL